MYENRYMAQKRFIVEMVGMTIIIWAGFFVILSKLTRGACLENALVCILQSPSAVVLILGSILLLYWRKIRIILRVPQVIVTDTELILDFRETPIKWDDISRINIYKNDVLIHKKSGPFRRAQDDITYIENGLDLIRDLERRCIEKNIPITKKRSWAVFYY